MTIRTLLAILAVAAMSCTIASGQTVVKTGDGNITVTVTASADSNHHGSGGGWLGVRISAVPAPLAAHLMSKNIGVMVTDLVKGSPAHKAGIQQYDVIVGLNDNAVKDGPGLIEAVSSHKAGDKVKLWVMRKGEKIHIQIVLGKPVPADKVQLLHEEHFHAAPNAAPGVNSSVSVSAKTVIHTKDSDGSDVRIEQDETGKITVCRKQRNDDGNQTVDTKTYKNREQLRLSDPEAFELLKKTNIKVLTPIKPGQMGKHPGGKMPDIRLFTGGDHAKLQKEIHEKILKSIEQMNLPDDVKKQLKKQLQINIRIQSGDGDKDDKPKDRKPGKKRKAKTPEKARKPKVENTSDTHI